MSQEQPRRPQGGADPIKYGDVFDVSGKLQAEPIMPQDTATMQAAENMVLGQTRKGGITAVMQSAAEVNVQTGAVKPGQVSHVVRDQGMTISQANIGGRRVVSEAVGGQVVGGYVQPAVDTGKPGGALNRDAITIGEALEASALSAGDKPMEHSDAAAIQAAEVRATGNNETVPGGIASLAQAAGTRNTRTAADEDKTKLADVLMVVRTFLPGDKAVTREDADRMIVAEMRNKIEVTTTSGGVAESMAVAARLNQHK
ncbi:late embryogenesis abundant protein D-34-like [Syzygium oleosum]|uniref:late embryogenesis abundant protein D-34-like n=1 Tax=Syzygium oleosum TaxID=219896 RepID=UPI0024BBEB07|nr:late embryogenesis abundant protein D-34-like [Syzygium oleosum]